MLQEIDFAPTQMGGKTKGENHVEGYFRTQ